MSTDIKNVGYAEHTHMLQQFPKYSENIACGATVERRGYILYTPMFHYGVPGICQLGRAALCPTKTWGALKYVLLTQSNQQSLRVTKTVNAAPQKDSSRGCRRRIHQVIAFFDVSVIAPGVPRKELPRLK